MPIPNTIKLIKFPKNDIIDVLIANNTTNEAGLQGSTIAPKKNPNRKLDSQGFFVIGELTFGKSFPKS